MDGGAEERTDGRHALSFFGREGGRGGGEGLRGQAGMYLGTYSVVIARSAFYSPFLLLRTHLSIRLL